MKLNLLIALFTVLSPLQIYAGCDKGALLTESAYKEAITAEIKNNDKWSGYTIDRFGSARNEYQVTLRKGLDLIELTFEAMENDRCKVNIKLLDEQLEPGPKKK